MPSDITGGSECRVEHGKFHRKVRKNFFPVGLTEHGNGLCREVVESPSVGIFEAHLDTHHCDLLQGTALAEVGLSDLLKSLPIPAVLELWGSSEPRRALSG